MLRKMMIAAALAGAALASLPAAAQSGMGGMGGMGMGGMGMGGMGMGGMGMGGMGMGGMGRHAMRGPVDCSKAADPARCEALKKHREQRQAAMQACGQLPDLAQRRSCMQAYMHPGGDCSKAPNPQRCEAMLQAQEACKNETGVNYRECIRQRMP